MTESFDCHAAIARLAEAEWECHSEMEHDYGTCAAGCVDGYIIPFKALRVPCPFDRETHTYHAMAGMLAETEAEKNETPPCCQGRGWVPEPDIEKACWRILKALSQLPSNPYRYVLPQTEQAVLLAAEIGLQADAGRK